MDLSQLLSKRDQELQDLEKLIEQVNLEVASRKARIGLLDELIAKLKEEQEDE